MRVFGREVLVGDWLPSATEGRNRTNLSLRLQPGSWPARKPGRFSKVRHQGLEKNAHGRFVALGLANLAGA
jgi:hypothetical protein